MNRKITPTSYIVLMSILGFVAGFYATKMIVTHSRIQVIPVQQIATIPKQTKPIVTKPISTIPPTKTTSAYSCPKPKVIYEDESFAYVGQDTPLKDKQYIPSDLVELDASISKYRELCVTEETSQALTTMINAARLDGKNIKVSSAFRSYATQQILLNNNLKETGNTSSDSVAKPGYSEHQLGVTVDLTSPSIANSSADGTFGSTPESAWLEANAYKYGFVQSYPKDKENITGYMYEPWHYRYVGISNAIAIKNSGMTITEFLR